MPGDQRVVWFVTHPEVLIDPAVDVPDWGLAPRGIERMRCFAAQARLRGIGAIWASTERKAVMAADILGEALGLPVSTLAELGENDRSSTGYLARDAFEAMADAFFAAPFESVRGWERAIDAQARIVAAVARVLAETPGDGEIAIVAHGAVGALYLGHLIGAPISRALDQPGGGGGNVFCSAGGQLVRGWQPIDG